MTRLDDELDRAAAFLHRQGVGDGCAAVDASRAGLYHLRRLVDWGYGEDAPDLAQIDWENAREWLEKFDACNSPAFPRKLVGSDED